MTVMGRKVAGRLNHRRYRAALTWPPLEPVAPPAFAPKDSAFQYQTWPSYVRAFPFTDTSQDRRSHKLLGDARLYRDRSAWLTMLRLTSRSIA